MIRDNEEMDQPIVLRVESKAQFKGIKRLSNGDIVLELYLPQKTSLGKYDHFDRYVTGAVKSPDLFLFTMTMEDLIRMREDPNEFDRFMGMIRHTE